MRLLLRRKLKTVERVVEGQQPIRPFRRVEHVEARSILNSDFTFADEESAQHCRHVHPALLIDTNTREQKTSIDWCVLYIHSPLNRLVTF